MPQKKIVPITGFREAEHQRMRAPAGGTTLDGKVSKRVEGDPRTLVTREQERLPDETPAETNAMSKRIDTVQGTRMYWISSDGNAGFPPAAAPAWAVPLLRSPAARS